MFGEILYLVVLNIFVILLDQEYWYVITGFDNKKTLCLPVQIFIQGH